MKYFLFILITIPSILSAQKDRILADSLFNNSDWAGAAKSYSKYLKKNRQDSLAWFRLGKSHANLSAHQKAIESFENAFKTNFYPSYVHFNTAKSFAAIGQSENMYASLEDAIESGFFNFHLLSSEEAFKIFCSEEKFVSIIEKAKENAYPCLSDPNSRHFDFWLGEWDVFVRGRKVGENSITMANGGCAINENYTTPGVYTGQSLNYYDKFDNKWHQTWVASGGGVLDYVEIAKSEGMLQFQCDYINAQGQILKSRLTFTQNEDGSVRQLFEDSSDGQTWTPSFDGLYKLKKE